MLCEYYELPDDERIKLRKEISRINNIYKRYCEIINLFIDDTIEYDKEVNDKLSEVTRIILNNFDKLPYHGLQFLVICMEKVPNTDIQYPIEFLNIIFNKHLYTTLINTLLNLRKKNAEITRAHKKYYFNFIYIELIKYKWLNTNYIPNDIATDNNLSQEQKLYNLRINEYIEEQIVKIIDLIKFLYMDIQNKFPEFTNEIALCKDIIFTFGNPIKLYYDNGQYIIS